MLKHPASGPHRRAGTACVVLAGVLLVGGCGASVQPSYPTSASGGEPKPAGGIKRCSPSDPDRSAWFCVVGQLLYNVVGGMQPDGGYSLR